jgi:hypothetical protein
VTPPSVSPSSPLLPPAAEASIPSDKDSEVELDVFEDREEERGDEGGGRGSSDTFSDAEIGMFPKTG